MGRYRKCFLALDIFQLTVGIAWHYPIIICREFILCLSLIWTSLIQNRWNSKPGFLLRWLAKTNSSSLGCLCWCFVMPVRKLMNPYTLCQLEDEWPQAADTYKTYPGLKNLRSRPRSGCLPAMSSGLNDLASRFQEPHRQWGWYWILCQIKIKPQTWHTVLDDWISCKLFIFPPFLTFPITPYRSNRLDHGISYIQNTVLKLMAER